MRKRAIAVPFAVVVGFALLAIVVASALPAASQTEPPDVASEPFQYQDGFTHSGAGQKCEPVLIPDGTGVTIEGFSALVESAQAPPVVYLLVQRMVEIPGGGTGTIPASQIRLQLQSTGPGTFAGHTLTLLHSHPIGDEPPSTYGFFMCSRRTSTTGFAQVQMLVSGYAVPMPTPRG